MTWNDLLNLEIKYKNDPMVLALIKALKEQKEETRLARMQV